ncbi:MAG: ribonuclease PH [Christensenellales bacterium]
MADGGICHAARQHANQKATRRRKQDGRSVEIQRLIGRSLRAVVVGNWAKEPSVWIATCWMQTAARTASITGLVCAGHGGAAFDRQGLLSENPITSQVAAVSCGIVEDTPVLVVLVEDSAAQVDMNFVMTGLGQFVEIQGTGEGRAFSQEEMRAMLALGQNGMEQLFALQRKALEDWRA